MVKHKFNIGDLVQCIDNKGFESVNIGQIYKVNSYIDISEDAICITVGRSNDYGIYARSFVLAGCELCNKCKNMCKKANIKECNFKE